MRKKLKPILDKIGSAAAYTRDATRYWFSRLARLWAFLVAVAVLVSVLAYFFLPFQRTRYYLEFPDAISGKLRGEVRYAPSHASLEKAAAVLCAEILAGPENLKSRPHFSRDTRVRSLMVRGGTLYLDLSRDLVLGLPEGGSFRQSLDSVEKSLKKNLIGVKKVVLTVDGNETYADNGEEEPGQKGSPGAAEPSSQAGRAP